jgi:Uma2 family endonuclease
MPVLSEKTISIEQYLEFEKTAELRHEFVEGQLFAMAGSNLKHNEIIFRIRSALTKAAQEKHCQIATESLKVQTQFGRYRYPDVVISCEIGLDEYFVENPCFIAEVQSDSTAETDNGTKLEEYTKIPSLQRYAIISQKTRQVVVYKREAEIWTFEVLLENGEIEIPCLDATLTLEQIYANLKLS